MPSILHDFLLNTNFFIIWYFLFINIGYTILLFTSISDIFEEFIESKQGNIDLFINSNMIPPITALVPAYNEEDVILNTVESLLRVSYTNLHICVINDGSDDKTMELLFQTYDLVAVFPVIPTKIKTKAQVAKYYISKKYHNLKVIDKEHSGKSDSLNMGINASSTPLFMSIDADTLVEPDAISKLAYSMLSKPHTIAIGGAIYILNGCTYEPGQLIEPRMSYSPLVAVQACEYLRAFIFGRTGWKNLGGPLILSGALTLFEKQVVIDVGGYKIDAPGEDMEIILALHEHMHKNKYPYTISYSFAAAAWTHVPENMNAIWSQRERWHRGLIDSLVRHKKMFMNFRYGKTGLLAIPFQFFGEFLGPIVECIGYIAVCFAMYYNVISWKIAVLFFVATWGFATIITLATTLISLISFNKYKRLSDVFLLFFLVAFESFGFRQVLSLCRLVASLRYVLKKLIPFD